jgi:hypothetical protein
MPSSLPILANFCKHNDSAGMGDDQSAKYWSQQIDKDLAMAWDMMPWRLFINAFSLPLRVIRLVQSVHW